MVLIASVVKRENMLQGYIPGSAIGVQVQGLAI